MVCPPPTHPLPQLSVEKGMCTLNTMDRSINSYLYISFISQQILFTWIWYQILSYLRGNLLRGQSVTPFPLYNIKQSGRLNQCNTKHAYPKGLLLTTRYSRRSSVREERTMGPCRGQIAAVTRASPGPVIFEKRTDLLIGMFNFDNMLDSRNFTSVYMERDVQKKVSHLK
jgi:hypothetical protein